MNDELKRKNKHLFFALIEKQVQEIGWGQIDVIVSIRDGQPLIQTMRMTKRRRRKYQIKRKSAKKT